MTNVVLCLGIAILAGLLTTRLCKPLGLPAVTGYLVAGILIGPYCLGQLGIEGLGFVSLHYVESLSVICDVALGFIAFSIGSEFKLSSIKKIGKGDIKIINFYEVGSFNENIKEIEEIASNTEAEVEITNSNSAEAEVEEKARGETLSPQRLAKLSDVLLDRGFIKL